jgi:hypothetical protein
MSGAVHVVGATRLGDRLASFDWLSLPPVEESTPPSPIDHEEAERLAHWGERIALTRPPGLTDVQYDRLEDRILRECDIDSSVAWHTAHGVILVRGVRAGREWVIALHEGKITSHSREEWERRALRLRETAETPDKARALVGRSLGELLQAPIRPVKWLLKDTLEEQVIALVAGPRGSYKSFLALEWAMRVAVDGKGVVVVSAEGTDLNRRAAAWLKANAPTVDPATIPLRVIERRLDLTTEDGMRAVRAELAALPAKPALLVLDTFSKLSAGLDENSNTEVKSFIGRLDNALKCSDTGFGVTVLLVAHTGHSDKGRARGASALSADTDAEYIVSRTPGGTMFVTRERFKSSPELPPLCFRPRVVELGVNEQSQPISSLVLDPESEHPAHVAKAKKLPEPGSKIRQAYDAAIAIVRRDGAATVEDVREAIKNAWVAPEGKDTRASDATVYMNRLVARKLLFLHPGELLTESGVLPGPESSQEE